MSIAIRQSMRDIEAVIDALLAKRPGGFRNKHLAEALGVSRGRAYQLLTPRVRSGELARTDGPRSRYIRGADHGGADGGLARGARPWGFWRLLVAANPRIVYVALRALGLTELRTRHQIRAALRGVKYVQQFLVVDFEGVHSISEAAAHELFLTVPEHRGIVVEAINVEPRVARAIGHVVRFGC